MHKRNELCSCGSGKKYKHCCLKLEQKEFISNTELNLRSTTRNKIKYVVKFSILVPACIALISILVSIGSDGAKHWQFYLDNLPFIFVYTVCLTTLMTVFRNTNIKLNSKGIYYTKFQPFGSEKHIPWHRVKDVAICNNTFFNDFQMKFIQRSIVSKKFADFTETVAFDFIDASKAEVLHYVSLAKLRKGPLHGERDSVKGQPSFKSA